MSLLAKTNTQEDTFKTIGSATKVISAGSHLRGDLSRQNDLGIGGQLTGNIYVQPKWNWCHRPGGK